MPTTTSGVDYAGSASGTLLISEILTKVNNAKDKPKKVEVLKTYDSQPLRQVLKGAFDPSIIWDLPDGTPPYKENDAPAGTEHTLLSNEAKRLWHFVRGGDERLSKTKKETINGPKIAINGNFFNKELFILMSSKTFIKNLDE